MRPIATPLEEVLTAIIASEGPIGVDAFMHLGLYHPQLGYYTTASPLGAAGDFITAPDISQMFGELIGLWVAQSWLDMGAPAAFQLVELGPGRGTLMADALRAASKVKGFEAATSVWLMEINPALKRAQTDALKAAPVPIHWFGAWEDLPAGPTIVLGNEFLDCLPVRQFIHNGQSWHEKQVGVDGAGRLTFGLGPQVALKLNGKAGRVHEEAPGLADVVGAIAERAATAPTRALFIDYGSSDGMTGDTLQAVRHHQKISPLDHVGEADLTAHVDFQRLACLASAAGLRVQGPVSQGGFLDALGITHRAATLATTNPARRQDLQLALERLTSPDYMGDLFKVMCLSSSGLPDAPALTPAAN